MQFINTDIYNKVKYARFCLDSQFHCTTPSRCKLQNVGNARLPMHVDAGRATEAKLLHHSNAPSPMVCNASGKATEAKVLHLANACISMVCNEPGKATEAKLLHS